MSIWPDLIGKVVGGFLGNKAAKDDRAESYRIHTENRVQQNKLFKRARKFALRDQKLSRRQFLKDRQKERQMFLRDRRNDRTFLQDEKERDRVQSVKDGQKSFSRLRSAAEKAGFNPLTVLGASGLTPGGGGGGGGGQAFVANAYTNPGSTVGLPPLASPQLVASGLHTVADAAKNIGESVTAHIEHQNELARIAQEENRSGVEVPKTSTVATTAPLVLNKKVATAGSVAVPDDGRKLRPRARPDLWSDGQTVLIKPDGTTGIYPTAVASRLGLKNWDTMIGEDYEALYGDELGQIVLGPRLPGAIQQNEGGVMGADVQDRIEDLRDRTQGDGLLGRGPAPSAPRRPSTFRN